MRNFRKLLPKYGIRDTSRYITRAVAVAVVVVVVVTVAVVVAVTVAVAVVVKLSVTFSNNIRQQGKEDIRIFITFTDDC